MLWRKSSLVLYLADGIVCIGAWDYDSVDDYHRACVDALMDVGDVTVRGEGLWCGPMVAVVDWLCARYECTDWERVELVKRNRAWVVVRTRGWGQVREYPYCALRDAWHEYVIQVGNAAALLRP